MCRFNRHGAFNVRFGRYARIAYRRDFLAYRPVLAGWTLSSADIADVPLEPDDFVYADPPYDVAFRQYGPAGFAWDDQVRTAERLAVHPGPVVLVNQATPRIAGLYRSLGYEVSELDGPRRIGCTGDRRPAREILAVRNTLA